MNISHIYVMYINDFQKASSKIVRWMFIQFRVIRWFVLNWPKKMQVTFKAASSGFAHFCSDEFYKFRPLAVSYLYIHAGWFLSTRYAHNSTR